MHCISLTPPPPPKHDFSHILPFRLRFMAESQQFHPNVVLLHNNPSLTAGGGGIFVFSGLFYVLATRKFDRLIQSSPMWNTVVLKTPLTLLLSHPGLGPATANFKGVVSNI